MRKRGVLVIGVDGLRSGPDLPDHAPHVAAIAAAGTFAALRHDGDSLASSSAWASVATGVPVRFHGVHDDELRHHRLASFPDFLHALSRADARARTFVATSRSSIARRLFRPAHQTVALRGEAIGYAKADDAVTQCALRAIDDRAFDAAFVHLGEPGETLAGADEPDRAALRRADDRIGKLTEALLTGTDSDWTIVVVTDRPRPRRGAFGAQDSTAWLAARGPGVLRRSEASHVDIFPTAFAALGLVPHRGYGLAGTALQEGS